jgi:hypothetical protein
LWALGSGRTGPAPAADGRLRLTARDDRDGLRGAAVVVRLPGDPQDDATLVAAARAVLAGDDPQDAGALVSAQGLARQRLVQLAARRVRRADRQRQDQRAGSQAAAAGPPTSRRPGGGPSHRVRVSGGRRLDDAVIGRRLHQVGGFYRFSEIKSSLGRERVRFLLASQQRRRRIEHPVSAATGVR